MITVKSLSPFGWTKKFCLLRFLLPYCVILTLKWPRGRDPWGPTTIFRIFYYFCGSFLLIVFFTDVICNCHPHGYASFDTHKKLNRPCRFLANYHNGGGGWMQENVLPLKSNRNENFQVLFQQYLCIYDLLLWAKFHWKIPLGKWVFQNFVEIEMHETIIGYLAAILRRKMFFRYFFLEYGCF